MAEEAQVRYFLAALLLAFPAVADEQMVICDGKGWCLIKQDSLQELLSGQRRLIAYVDELQKMCGWQK